MILIYYKIVYIIIFKFLLKTLLESVLIISVVIGNRIKLALINKLYNKKNETNVEEKLFK